MNYHDKLFRPISNTVNGETSEQTVFHYKQTGNILTAEYAGGQIQKGHLIGVVDELGNIDMRYHQVINDRDLPIHTWTINEWKNTPARALGVDVRW